MAQKKNILVIGGAGFVGSNLVHRLVADGGSSVTVLDSLDPVLKSTKAALEPIKDKITFVQGDMRDDALLRKLIPSVDLIFNCAAQTSHPYSLENPVYDAEINCIGNLKLLLAIREHNPKATVVYTSSSTIIGKAAGDIIDEAHGEKPLDIYSANKGVAEKYYRIFNRVYDLKTIVLRFANLYGPYGKNDPAFGFVNYFINQAAEGKPITLFGDGGQTRNVMYIEDAVEIMLRAPSYPKLYGEAHFATHHDHHTVKEIAETIVSVFGTGSVTMVPWPDIRKRIEIEKVFISSARLHYLTDWKPKNSLREGLEKTKQIMRSAHEE